MVSVIVSFLCGILFLQQWALLPAISWSWILLSLGLFPFLAAFPLSPFLVKAFRLLLLFIAGFSWALLRAHWVLDIALPPELQGKDVLATGVIASIPVSDTRKQRFEFDIESLRYKNKNIPFRAKVRVNWYQNRAKKNKQFNNKQTQLKAGQRWQLWLRLKQPYGFINPGGFDYEGWLYQKKIRATGYVRINYKQKKFAKLLDNENSGYSMLVLRQNLYEKLNQITSNTQFGGILVALAMGERSGISLQQWQVFRATGINHLVAISGLHIGLLAGLVFFLSRKLWAYAGTASLNLASPRAAALIALAVAAFYAALSGFAVPAQRALIMLSIVLLSVFLRQKVQTSHVLSLALLCVLILDPIAVMSPGFWLSFSAVTIIGFAAFGRLSFDKNLRSWGRLQWRISLALIPLLVYLFQQASFVSPLANLVAIPVVSLLVVPLVLFATTISYFMPDLALMLYLVSDGVFDLLWWLMAYLADTPMSQWYGVKSDLVALCLASLGIALLLTPKGWPVRYLGLFLVVPLFWPHIEPVRQGEVEVTLLDVGQGLSAVVQTQQHVLLFDTGAKFSQKFDIGAAVIVPFIRQKNINKLDMLIVSHQDNDHRGGLGSIQKTLAIDRLLTSYAEKNSTACQAGHSWLWDGVLFEILNPDESVSYKKRNNASCVLRVSAGQDSILLTADIEKQTEKRLLKSRFEQLKSTYLVAPHHGSKTSSSKAFLEAVNPDYVMVPVGYMNRYRMPHHSVIKRYRELGVEVLESHKSGAISVRFGQKTSNKIPEQYRKHQQKYWNSRQQML